MESYLSLTLDRMGCVRKPTLRHTLVVKLHARLNDNACNSYCVGCITILQYVVISLTFIKHV